MYDTPADGQGEQQATEFQSLQKDSNFPPDKEGTWSHAKETDGWMHAHNAIRAEIELLLSSLEPLMREELSTAKIYFIQTAWKCHYDHVHAHHSNEDLLFVPFLSTRFEYPEQHEADHEALISSLESLRAVVESLAPGDTCGALYDGLKEYQSIMLPHLAAEEGDCLPLMRAFFTQEEIAPMVQKIIAAGPIVEMGSFIACMGVEAFRNDFMVQEGIPVFVWEKDFKARYQVYEKQFVKPLELLSAANLLEI